MQVWAPRLCCLGFVSLTQALTYVGRESLVEKSTFIRLAYMQVYGGMVLINDWWVVALMAVGGPIQIQVVLSFLRK